MSDLNEFPFEVMSLIFQGTWELYLLDDPPLKKEPRRIFPFNAAAVCAFWLDVLKSEPRYWKCVTFDVGHDPTPFLDTLGLHTGGDIDVCVISSRKSRVTELQEKSRVQEIYTRMKPRLSICSAIEFDLVFQSSLPSATDILTHHIPCLSSLSFRCAVHNCDDNSLDIKINANKKLRKKNPRSLIFPALRRLSLTGYSFMELRQLGEKWAEISIADLPQSSLHLSVNHFQFHERGQWADCRYSSLYVFLKTIALWTKYKNFELVLQDFSIDYHPNTDYELDSMSFTSIKFKDVSRDFISAFFGSFSAPSWRQLGTVHFVGCSIPCIPNCAWSQTNTLIIGYTPFRKFTTSRSSIATRLNDSLYNAVSAFQLAHLILRGCEDLDDAFFNWCWNKGRSCLGWGPTSLDIAHCKEFSAAKLCNFIQVGMGVPPFRKLSVKGGQNTLLKRYDAQWFREKKQYINVDWTVSYEGEVSKEYLKTFHTHK